MPPPPEHQFEVKSDSHCFAWSYSRHFHSLVVIPSRLRVQSGLWERVCLLSSTWGEERQGKLLGILRTPSSDPDILFDVLKCLLRRILGRFLALSFLKDEAAQWTCVLKQLPLLIFPFQDEP